MDAKILQKLSGMSQLDTAKIVRLQKREKELSKTGKYTPPQEIHIQGIPAVIVDPHNEVLPYWEKIGHKAVVLHVDKHDDMADNVLQTTATSRADSLHKILDGVITRRKQDPEFAEHLFAAIKEAHGLGESDEISTNILSFHPKPFINIENFIIVASYKEAVSVIYHSNPRYENIMAFGRIKNGIATDLLPITIDEHHALLWDKMKGIPISTKEMIQDLRTYHGNLILDIDLDGFVCFDDTEYKHPAKLGKVIDKRFAQFKMITTNIQRPDLITIARSQTPDLFTPKELVDSIQQRTIDTLAQIYKS